MPVLKICLQWFGDEAHLKDLANVIEGIVAGCVKYLAKIR
jgi:hypothetical protein